MPSRFIGSRLYGKSCHLVLVLMNEKEGVNSSNIFDNLVQKEHIFKDREALAMAYIPDEFPHREVEIKSFANILKPALYGARPSNILIYGQTGTGKTAISRFLCNELTKKAKVEKKGIHSAYINCKQTNTSYGILSNIGKSYSHHWEKEIPDAGWRIDKVYSSLKERADKIGGIAIVVLDEIDVLVNQRGDDVLYHLTGLNSDLDNSKISLIGISNDSTFTSCLDPRVKSRMGEEALVFSPYNAPQIEDILSQRARLAFHENVIDPLVLSYCASKAAQEHGDVRKAINLLRISAELAEREGSEKVNIKHLSIAQEVMEKNHISSLIGTMPIHHKAVLSSIILNQDSKEKGQQTTGEVYSTYNHICKIFELESLSQRRIGNVISELDMQGLINAKVVSLGRQGRTRFINMAIGPEQIEHIIRKDASLSNMIEIAEKSGRYNHSLQLRLI